MLSVRADGFQLMKFMFGFYSLTSVLSSGSLLEIIAGCGLVRKAERLFLQNSSKICALTSRKQACLGFYVEPSRL